MRAFAWIIVDAKHQISYWSPGAERMHDWTESGASLLNMQAGQIEEPRIAAISEETRNGIQSIASIHEVLYRAGSFSSILVQDYARQLVVDLVGSYGLEGKLRVEVAAKHVVFDPERARPFGLLLNELVSNACNHAFQKKQDGCIRVSCHKEGNASYDGFR
jgi:two-component sensor histidine kinase